MQQRAADFALSMAKNMHLSTPKGKTESFKNEVKIPDKMAFHASISYINTQNEYD